VALAEDVYLLACDAATGRPRIAAMYLDLGLAGALLCDLVLRGRITLVDDHVAVLDTAPVGDPLSDTALRAIAADTRLREPDHWVHHLVHGLRAAVQRSLVSAGVLTSDEHRLLGVIPVHHTHCADAHLEDELVRRIEDAVVLGRPASRETAAVVSVALAIGLDRHLFPRSDRGAVRRRMATIAADDWVGAAVTHAVAAVNAALGLEPGTTVADG
jgi:hypothetical protein